MVTEGTPSSRLLCLGTGSLLPGLAGRPVGDAQAKASHCDSQGQSQEVPARERPGAPLLPPHPSPVFLQDNDSDGDDDDTDGNEGHYDSYHVSPCEAPT